MSILAAIAAIVGAWIIISNWEFFLGIFLIALAIGISLTMLAVVVLLAVAIFG